MRRGISTGLLLLLTLAGAVSPSQAAKVGPEFRVNTYLPHLQYSPSVAALGDGGFVVAWQSDDQDGSSTGIYGQRFSAGGGRIGAEFRVNTTTKDAQYDPHVAALANGGFVVTWTSQDPIYHSSAIFGQRYSATGARAGGQIQVGAIAVGGRSAVAGLSDGGFAVVWAASTIFCQRYGANGAAVGSTFIVGGGSGSAADDPDIAALSNGGFVVTWTSREIDLSTGIQALRFDAGGMPQGETFVVNTYRKDRQELSSVVALKSGGFVVAWQSKAQDASTFGVYAQRFDATGARVGAEFRANTHSPFFQGVPSVGALSNGGFVITWHSLGQDGSSSYGVYGQRYVATGAPFGVEFRANTRTAGDQASPSVAGLKNGGFIVTWMGADNGKGANAFGQRFNP
jgi:hypothetical protein